MSQIDLNVQTRLLQQQKEQKSERFLNHIDALMFKERGTHLSSDECMMIEVFKEDAIIIDPCS